DVGPRSALDLPPDAVSLVQDRGAPPALDRVQAGDPGGQLNHDEPDQLAREKVREGGGAGGGRVGGELDGSVGGEGGPHPLAGGRMSRIRLGTRTSVKNESSRSPAKILIPSPTPRTSPTGALGGVMIVPWALRLVASAPVSRATCTYWAPVESGGEKVKRQVM